MDGEFPWILFGVFALWMLRVLGQARRGTQQSRQRRPPPKVERPRTVTIERTPPPPRVDPTQREGGQLEELLRALEQTLDPTRPRSPRPQPSRAPTEAGPLGRHGPTPLRGAEEAEERDSLEQDREAETLEAEVLRPERARPDWLAAAEARERARSAAVEARDAESQRSRHAAFDRRIRQEPADHTAVRRLTPAQVRQAFVWAEILGRPKSEQ